MCCYGNTRNAWQSPAVDRQAHRTPHALRMPAKTPLTSDKIDAPAACATLSATRPFHFVHTVVTRTRNVSECMLVLALCLVFIVRRNTIRTVISQHKNNNVNLFLYTVIISGLVRWRTMRCSLVNKVLRPIVTSNPSRLKATAACVLGLPLWMPRV